MFAGVDALILGSIIPKNQKISLNAKIITTETAEIVGAAKTEFKTDDTVQKLLSQEAKIEDPAGSSEPRSTAKPFGDLQAKVESLKLLPSQGPLDYYGTTKLTLVISNASTSKTYGIAVSDYDRNWHLNNSREEEFETFEVNGIAMGGLTFGNLWGSITDIPPKCSITIVAKSHLRWNGKPGDYRPYRLQTEVLFGVEDKGRYVDLKKHNLVLDIK